jgi:hypothetical protein
MEVMTPATIVLVPYPVPVPIANGMGWERRLPPPPYPRERRDRWPIKTAPPINRDQVRALIADARRLLCEDRASRLLRELER